MVSYIGSMIATEVFTGFTNLYDIGRLGPRDFEKTGLVYLILIASRSMALFLICLKLSSKKEENGNDKFGKQKSSSTA